MQNPALGAALVWRFVCGFCPDSSPTGAPLPLAFVVLPLAFHAKSIEGVLNTKPSSGMRLFEEKFRNEGDVLLAIQPRMMAMRKLSLRSLRIALGSGLLTLVPQEAVLWPRSRAAPPVSDAKVINELLKSAEKLGAWCRDISLFEIAGLLKVEF